MPLIATKGAASAQGFGEFAQSGPVNYIEDVFSTWLYTGNGTSQTITNNIDLSGKGGLVWIKQRNAAASHFLYDSARSWDSGGYIQSNSTAAAAEAGLGYISVSSTGFSLPTSVFNESPNTFASWTFREQAKFFDVVTYTGDNTSSKAISHNLGSVPGCVIVKRTDSASHWFVWHRSTSGTPNNDYTLLNQTAATAVATDAWSSNAFTSTQFYVSNNLSTNVSGATYVAYLFAHDAGGFGLTGSDNVISCGSYTGNGSTSGPTVTLGYEPQWLLIKRTSGGTGNWVLIDSMRGFVNSTTASPSDAYLVPNTAAAEQTWGDFTGTSNAAIPLATGFQIVTSTATLNNNTDTYIYIAIRRGPMKTPTVGTSVFSPVTQAGSGTVTTNFPVDLSISTIKSVAQNRWAIDRLRGASGTASAYMYPNATNAEATTSGYGLAFDNNTGYKDTGVWSSGNSIIYWNFQRAPGFFDEVCYTGNSTGSTTQTLSHNLTTTPELIIIKGRSAIKQWEVQCSFGVSNYKLLRLNLTDQAYTESYNNANIYASAPTSTQFQLGGQTDTNGNTVTYVAYLFASLSGISKVGSYTGTGALQTVNCGFTGGARFVLIKRTDSTGDWWVYDSARGISSGNDPYLFLNSTAAEVTNTNYVDTTSVGFQVTAAAPAGLNANGGTYIFLAIS